MEMIKKTKPIFKVILAGVLMAFAWSLRGQFGHLHGALIPGTASVLILSFLMTEEHWRESTGKALLLAPIGFAVGGHISYGKLFEAVAHAAAFGVVKDEFTQLFWVGVVWGGIGGTFLGFGFSEKKLTGYDALAMAIFILTGILVLEVLRLPISNLVYFSAGLFLLQIYNLFYKKSILLPVLFLTGSLAFGAAFLLAGILLSAGYQGYLGQAWAWWIYRDQILGFTAGVFFWGIAAGLQQFKLRRFPAESMVIWQQIGFSFWLIFITGVNTLDVAMYWLRVKTSQNLSWCFAALAFLLILCVWSVLSASSMDYFNPKIRRTLRNAVLLSYGIWSFEAIFKQAVAFNFHHWEGAYTFFIVFFIFLCAALPLQIKNLEREN